MARWSFRLIVLAWLAVAVVLVPFAVGAQGGGYEVWVVDQADADKGGAKLYIYPGSAFGGAQLQGQPEVVDLTAAAAGVGDGAGVRPHFLLFNAEHTHAILAYVASGHVQVIRAADRKVVASIDVGEQAHEAVASPDGSFILVANQNGKKLAKIRANFATEQFTYDPAEDLDLGALENPDRPDNAPICPTLLADGGRKAYVTLRGGGLFVVDTASSPMRVTKVFPRSQVAPAGCGGLVLGNQIFVNSGTATASFLYVFDLTDDALVGRVNTSHLGTDAHGMVLVGGDRYLWMAHRGDGDNIAVIDAASHEVVNTFGGFGAAPDLMDRSPDGTRVFMTLRGPNNLTGGPPAKGETPGLAVLAVQEDGRSGARVMFVPIGDQSPSSTVDPHAVAVRHLTSMLRPIRP